MVLQIKLDVVLTIHLALTLSEGKQHQPDSRDLHYDSKLVL